MANFFCSAGYGLESIHSGMIAYLCGLWDEGNDEPLGSFLDHLAVPLETGTGLRVKREWKRIDVAVLDTRIESPVVAVEMKVDSREGLVKGEPQTIAYPRWLGDAPFLYVTLGAGEFYHRPQGEGARWVRLRDFYGALKAVSTNDPFIDSWREAVGNEVDLQDRCFSGNRERLREYRGRTWSLYLLGHLREKLVGFLSGRDIGIDPFVYSLGPGPDTILYFGRSKLPAYLEINNNGKLNLKVYLADLPTAEEKEGRVRAAQGYYHDLLRTYDQDLNARKLRPNAKSWTLMSFDIGLVPRNGNLFYASDETHVLGRLSEILETFYGSPPFEQANIDPAVHPPYF